MTTTPEELQDKLVGYLLDTNKNPIIQFSFADVNPLLSNFNKGGKSVPDEIKKCLNDYFFIPDLKAPTRWQLDGIRFPLGWYREPHATLPAGVKLPLGNVRYVNGYLCCERSMDIALRDELKKAGNADYKNAIDNLYNKSNQRPGLQRTFAADLLWLFYYERMGIFKILAVILDDFGIRGKLPIGSKGMTAETLEHLVRLTKQGLSSTVRDRDSSYRRCLGWTSDIGKKLALETNTNGAFNSLFHKFIQCSLEYYQDKRLAVAIQAAATAGKPSAATLTTISETINLLQQAMKPFEYGRNHTHTVNGIVWVIVGMGLIWDMKTTLGIPDQYDLPSEYISAAYDILVAGRPAAIAGTNRYTVHKQCADKGRDVLLSLQNLEWDKSGPGEDLECWLTLMETKIEAYRTAYFNLFRVDLGKPGVPIEQQA